MHVSIRPLRQEELPQADAIFQQAFAALNKGSSSGRYDGDTSYMKRWFSESTSAFGAEVDGQLVGSNFAIRWGSFGLFGPLTVHPDFWGHKIAQQLIKPAMDCFEYWGTTQVGFFTRSNSPKHLHLYQKFGFYPRFLIAIMSKLVSPTQPPLKAVRYSELPEEQKFEYLALSQQLTNQIYNGLNLEQEIRVIYSQKLGDTLFLLEGKHLKGLAICHSGKGTEAGSQTGYIKFGAVHPRVDAEKAFTQLLQECESWSLLQGASQIAVGVSTARQEAYQQMMGLGFKTDRLGIAMHLPNNAAFCRPGIYVVDDWR